MTGSKLRREAEQRINQQVDRQAETDKPENRQLQKIIEELQVYQVELDIQNDELRKANDELEATRNRYADLYDLAPVGYFTLGKDSTIIEVNLTGTSMLGMNREKILNCKLTAFINHAFQDKFFRCFRQCFRAGKKISCDLKFQQITGESFFAHLEGNLTEGEPDVEPCCRVILSDITARFTAEKALRSARDQWIRTFESISDSVTILDTEMRVVKANRACALLLKQPTKNLLGRFCHDIFRSQENICSKCPVKQVLETGKSQSMEITNDLLHKTFQVSASPIMDENDQLTGVVQIARDITKRKMLEKQLVQTQKMEAIGTLAGGIAHDFNNILTAIIGYAKLGLLRLPDNQGTDVILDNNQLGQLTDYLQEIHAAGERAGKLVSQILTFSRQHAIVYKPMELAPIVKESVKFLRSTLPSTITIEQSIHPESAPVLADPTQILQVLMNLCTNAAHAMQEHGGTLTIELQPRILSISEADFYRKLAPGHYVELRISDTGHGMSSEFMERIFDPFFTTKDKGQGTGLGLAVVEGIVSKIGGFIQVDSTLGEGSIFHVLLPAYEGSTDVGKQIENRSQLPEGNEHVLVVDDEKILREMMARFLQFNGYKVTSCSSGMEALKLINANPYDFDLMITDQTMPKMTGKQLTRESLKIRSDLPIILMTGYSEDIDKNKTIELGLRAFLMKPIILEELAMTIRKIFDKN